MKASILNRLLETGVMPVVRVDSADLALRVAEALLEGGAGTVEITATVPGSPRVIEALSQRFPELLVGAGTIWDAASARAAIDAGARYIVSAGLVPEVIATAHRYGVPAMPGVMTPTEAAQALAAGADVLKLFPASLLGPSYLKALRGPLPHALWCPTGGVQLDNLAEWVAAGVSMVGIGSPLLQDVAKTRDFAALAQRMRQWNEAWRGLH
ncbi:MAG: bifunctional 4-hydroxy-2-oxoglutarate aldolase/2-dehydro-3-deoxy-phosphogluconate aldolase [Limnochordales bacterium]|nr:bifunctional 4-hydroxy-2-oxoglutarate aldolase/2-dehydro-3-deoxy-phosphogluconate aldolase [Limnochordales bacterium]